MRKIILLLCLACFCIPGKGQTLISGTLTLTPQEITIDSLEGFSRIRFQQGEYTADPGKPQLPVKTLSYVVPFDAVVTGVQVTSLQKQHLPGVYTVYPAQYPIPTGGPSPGFAPPDSLTYHSSSPYPGKTAEIISDEYTQGYHVVTLRFYPVEYIPSQGKLSLCSISFSLNYTLTPNTGDEMRFRHQTALRAELNKASIKAIISNPQDIDLFGSGVQQVLSESNRVTPYTAPSVENFPQTRSNPVTQQLIPDYLIITNNSLKPAFERLADWKTKKGVPAVIKTIEEIEPNYPGNDLQEKIRNFLKEAYRNWGAGLFVLLAGDVNIIPARIVYLGTLKRREVYGPCDLYYCALKIDWNANKNNIYNEKEDKADYGRYFYLGRASVENPTEANTFIDKILTYETTNGLPDLSYLNNVLAADAFIGIDSTKTILSEGYMNSITGYLNSLTPSNIQKWRIYDNHNCANTAHIYPSNGNCEDGTCTSCGDEELNHDNLLSAINNGGNSKLNHFHLVYHMDHSSEYGLGASSLDKNQSITREEIDNLTNGKYYQIIMSGGCNPADFSVDCIAEHYLNLPDNGCVAFIGNTKHGWANEYPQFEKFLKAIYKKGDNTLQNAYSLGYAFNQASSFPLLSKYHRLHLLGDPEMPVWTDTPKPLQVSVSPSSLSSAGNIMIITLINLPQGVPARICLSKGEDGYAAQTVQVKEIPGSTFLQRSFYFYFTPKSPGEVTVTVTAHNYIPFQTTIPVTGSSSRSLFLSDKRIQDDNSSLSQGNDDGQCDAGETIALWMTLKNNGSSWLDSVKAQVQCFSPLITLLDSVIPFGTIPSGDSLRSALPLRFKIDRDAPEIWTSSKSDSTAIFFLQITDHDNNWYTDSIGVDLFASDPEQRSKNILLPQTGLSTAHAGDSIVFDLELFNGGKAAATGINVTVAALSNLYLEGNPQTVAYPDIPFGEIKTGNTPFRFRLTSAYTGQKLTFRATVINRFGKTWTMDFDLDRPSAIDAGTVDYNATYSEIELIWPALSGAQGYNIYRKNASGEFEKLNPFLLKSTYFKDTRLPGATTYTYKISAVSTTGNEGDLSGEIKANTNFPYQGKFPIFTQTGYYVLSSMTTADRPDGKKNVFAALNHDYGSTPGYLLGLDYEGGDLFNADHNVTTHGDYAKFPNPVSSTPVTGDLYGSGENLIVIATRNLVAGNTLACFRMQDLDGDTEPDKLWERSIGVACYRTPIMANLDGNSMNRKQIIVKGRSINIEIYDYNGDFLRAITPPITDPGTGCIGVADLDGDGDLEIIAGYTEGVFIWHHDGTNFQSYNPVFKRDGFRFDSSVVICDLNGDGQKEILIAAKDMSKEKNCDSPVFAFSPDGTLLPGWNGTQKNIHAERSRSHDIAVADLNGNGYPEVVSVGCDFMKVWNHNGVEMCSVPTVNMNPYNLAPILADVDGDNFPEIIFNSKMSGTSKVFGYKLNGQVALGFPLSINGGSDGSPCVADIDGDGKNEVIVASGSDIYAWKTEGKPSAIEWGYERGDHYNTGEYLTPTTQIYDFSVTFTSTPHSITLTWPPVANVMGYYVYRKLSDGSFAKLNALPLKANSYTDSDLEKATNYIYRISVVSDRGKEGKPTRDITTHTTYPLMPGFPIYPKLGHYFFSSVNVAEFGDQGKKIFSALNNGFGGRPGYLFAVNPDGSNLYAGDSSIKGDFAYFADPMYGTPAIGDLNGDGENLIVAGTMDQRLTHNTIACYRIDDKNNDGKPDLVWEKTVTGPYYQGPVIANLDGNTQGKKQILFLNQYKPIEIYNPDGSLLRTIKPGIEYIYNGGAPAVASLRLLDTRKQIIAGYKEGVYIWNQDGTDYGPTNPVFTRPGFRFDSSVVICDIDEDGEKEILIAAKEDRTDDSPVQSPIFAFKPDGTPVPGWDGSQRTTYTNTSHSHDISVGDIDNDGYLEVVAVGIDTLKIWEHEGIRRVARCIEGMLPYNITPILADVNGDKMAEILVTSNKSNASKIWGLTTYGDIVPGFPITVIGRSDGSLCVDDIDGDGKNEIIGGSTVQMYMWKTDGRPDRIEWGRSRYDQYNTGEYRSELCKPTYIDFFTFWTGTREVCGDLLVLSKQLTIGNTDSSGHRLIMAPHTCIYVYPGAQLILDNASIENAKIRVFKDGELILKSNAKIWLSGTGSLQIDDGALFDGQHGNVDLMENISD